MSLFSKLRGTIETIFGIGLGTTRVNLKNGSGTHLEVRNADDTGYLGLKSSFVDLQDANGQRARLAVPDLAGDYTLTMPPDDGSPGQVLQTDGSGGLSWVANGSAAGGMIADTTALAFGSASPLTLFTLPANAVIFRVRIIVDTAFNGTTPQVTIGISGTTAKYTAAADCDLKTAGEYVIEPGVAPVGSTENLIATYTASGSSVGAARIVIEYAVPA